MFNNQNKLYIYYYKTTNNNNSHKKKEKQRKKAKKLRNAKLENKPKDEASLKIENQIEAIKKVINDEPIPTEMEAKETFFMQQLQKGEMLSYQGIYIF